MDQDPAIIDIEGEFTADHLTQQYGYCWALFLREESLLQQLRSQLKARRGLFALGCGCAVLYAALHVSGAHIAITVASFVMAALILFMACASASVFASAHDPKQRHRDLTITTLMGRGERTDALLGPVRMTFDASGIVYEGGSHSWSVAWDAVLFLFESEGSFGIDTPWDAHAVPKSWFDGADELQRFRDRVVSWSGKALVEIDVPQSAPPASEVLNLRSRVKSDASAGSSRR